MDGPGSEDPPFCFPHGIPHIHVPEAVAEQAQHADSDGIHQGDELVLLQGVAGDGVQVREDGAAVVQSDGGQVGDAGGQGLEPPGC